MYMTILNCLMLMIKSSGIMTNTIPDGYMPQTCETLPYYLSDKLPQDLILGGKPETWTVTEVGDGNLNLVFIVSGSERAIVVKQALPYVRAAGESWKLSINRAFFEYNVLLQENKYAGNTLVPEVYFYDPQMAAFAMEYLAEHIILRKKLIAGEKQPGLEQEIGFFLAKTLFHTSDIGMDAVEKKTLVANFANNHELCKITEDLIFTEPYFDAPRNNWTSPQLDEEVHALWQDVDVIHIAMKYKYKFMTEAQALLHGDLHSGSIMVSATDSKVIDPEFGFMGPMAFDIGNYIGNLYLAYFAQVGLQADIRRRQDYQAWLLEQIEQTWSVFEQVFRQLWNEKQSGEAYPHTLYQRHNPGLLQRAQDDFFKTLLEDTLVNAGLEMNRRIVGFAGVADFKTIADASLRAQCERSALKMARELIVNASAHANFSQLKLYASAC